MDVAATFTLMEHGAALKVMPVQSGKQDRLEVGHRLRDDDRTDLGERLLKTHRERVVGGGHRRQVAADPIETCRVAPQGPGCCRPHPPGRVHGAGNVFSERRRPHFDWA